uniref:Ku C-terminal domain-containing protein n=1 Tax=Musca domestica TaxID=7370 RepID=A0A1I8N9X9_MUSDO
MSQDSFESVPDDFGDFDATLSLTNPVEHYEQLMQEKMMTNLYVPDQMKEDIWFKIDAAARDAVWKLLFSEYANDEEVGAKEKLAATLLEKHKRNAAYYCPSDYNEWVVKLRDELLRRERMEFWRTVVVAKELGPAWARDSDMYDDLSDPEPAAYYNYGGCRAAWLENGH